MFPPDKSTGVVVLYLIGLLVVLAIIYIVGIGLN